MKIFRDLYNKNKSAFILSFIIWIAAFLFGIYGSAVLGEKNFTEIENYTRACLENTGFSFLLLNGIENNAKLIMLLITCSSIYFLLPAVCFLIAFKGFCTGFTTALIFRIYSYGGIKICFFSILIPYAFSLPLYMIIFSTALRFSTDSIRNKNLLDRSEKIKQWFAYVLFNIVVFILLCICSIFEAAITTIVV